MPASVKVEFSGEAPVLTPTCPFDSTMIESTIVLASLNFVHACCVPGALAGVWGLLMLGSDEGREHFAR